MRKSLTAVAATLFCALAFAQTRSVILVRGTATPDFTLVSSASTKSIAQGGSSTVTLTVAALNSFTGAVALAVTGTPSNATIAASPTSITGGAGTSTLTLTMGSGTPTGTSTITVTGTSGQLSHSVNIALTVTSTGSPDFTITSNTSSQSIPQGSSGTFTVTLAAQNGCSATTNLSVTGTTSGMSAAFSPTSLPCNGSSTLTVTNTSGATIGTANLTVTAAGTTTHTLPLTVGVTSASTPDFSVSPDSSSKTMSQSATQTFTITLSPTNGYNNATDINVTAGLPSGMTASCSPSSIVYPDTSCTLTVTTTPDATAGTANLTVTASGSQTHTLPLGVTVTQLPTSTTEGTFTDYYDANRAYNADDTVTYSTLSDVNTSQASYLSPSGPIYQALQANTNVAIGSDIPYVGASPTTWATASYFVPYIPRGDYNSGTTYAASQCVNASGNFDCALQTSSSAHPPGSTTDAYWQHTAGGVTPIAYSGTALSAVTVSKAFKGEWQGGTNYAVPSYVTHLSNLYYALQATQGVEPGTEQTPTNWQLVAYPLDFRDAGHYSPIITYSPNDGVEFNGSTYVANRFVLNQLPQPQASSAAWTITTVGPNTPQVLSSISPSNAVSVHAGDSQVYTLSFQPVWGCTGTITPTLSGLPSGATYTFSPTTLANCTGSTTATVSLPATTALASYTLSFNGTIGGTPGLYPPASAMTVVAPGYTQLLSNTTYSNFNITSVGTRDWIAWSGSGNNAAGFYQKGNGTTISNIRTIDCADPQFYNYTQAVPTISFTDGPVGNVTGTSSAASGSSGGGGGCHTYFDIPYTSAAPLTVFVYFGKGGNDGYAGRVTVANDFDHTNGGGGPSANPVGVFTTPDVLNGYPNYSPHLISFKVQGTSSSGTISVQVNMVGGGSSPAVQAVAIQ